MSIRALRLALVWPALALAASSFPEEAEDTCDIAGLDGASPRAGTLLQTHRSKPGGSLVPWQQLAADDQHCANVHSLRYFRKGVPAVVINGEPKSGTTWLEFLVREVFVQGCANCKECACTIDADDRSFKAEMPSGVVSFTFHKKHVIPGVGHSDSFDLHQPPSRSDGAIECAARAALRHAHLDTQWVAIFRDPRAVTLSSCYHHAKGCPHADQFLSGRIKVIAQWINLRHRFFQALRKIVPQRVHMLYYEEMREHELGTIGGLASFFGLSMSTRQVELIRNHTTLSNMKKMSAKQVPQGGAKSGKVRKGESCAYAKELTKDATERVSKMMRESLSPELNARWSC